MNKLLPACLLGCLLVVATGCEREASIGLVEIADTGELSVGLTDGALFDELETVLLMMYFDPNGENSCGSLVDDGTASLNDRAPTARQAIAVRGAGARDDHVFGNIPASGRYSFVMLGSHRRAADFRGGDVCSVDADCASELCRGGTEGMRCDRAENPLALAVGTVVAVGCEEITVVQTFRTVLSVRLFPAGLR